MKNLERLFKRYDLVLNAWRRGEITEWMKDKLLTETYCESGYKSPLKFYMDYLEWLNKGYKQLSLFGEDEEDK